MAPGAAAQRRRALWRIADTTADTVGEAMRESGRWWCRIIGPRPGRPAPSSPTGRPGACGDPSPLVKAVGETLIAVLIVYAPHQHATVLDGAHDGTLTDPTRTADTIGAAT